MSPTTQIEPLPVRWQDELFGVVVLTALLVFVGSLTASLPTDGDMWAFLAGIGNATAGSVVDVLLGFAATVAFAFGVSLGGQLIVRDPDTRSRIRRTTGGVSQLLMIASLVLVSGEVTDAVRHPARLGILAATVPLVVTTVAFGCHVAGLNVPRFDRQLEVAHRELAVRRAQKTRLPSRWARSRRRVVASVLAHVVVAGVLGSAVAVLSDVSLARSVVAGVTVAVAAGTVGCFTLAIPAAALTADTRRTRVAARTWPVTAMTLVVLYAWGGSVLVSWPAALPLAVLDAVVLTLGIAATFPLSAAVPGPLGRYALNGITARSARIEVLRSIRRTDARLRLLDAHAAVRAAQARSPRRRPAGWRTDSGMSTD